jgi:hypothetical protein
MDIAFAGERDKFVVIYLDDITVFSKNDEDHFQHLKQVFNKCTKFGLSLNPKKSYFAVEEGKLLGHLVSKKEICVDPTRAEAIQAVALPRNRKEIQSFLGKINFLRRFVPNFVELVNHITVMLRKENEIIWDDDARKSFITIKSALTEAPVLASPYFSKYFLTVSYASEDTIAVVLL